ncbi:MAG: hypothetical protein L0Z48_11850 [candidate division Zixibacteria bacterium]|nr:hypothetical protein [candidate division Zixibacteria bacterium]MCI0597217.1 hypothetical protein [candidate division Zixibacteria bacterium]
MGRRALGIAGLAIFALLAVGCNSRGGGGTDPGDNSPFEIRGIFVRDANLTSTKDKADFQLTRNDTLFHLAALTVDTFKVDTTAFMTYYRQSPPDYLRPGQSHSINLVYAPNNLNFTTSLLMPDTFSITFPGLNPDHQNPGGQAVQLDWTGSANANGYLIYCSNDSAFIDTAFFASTGVTQATIPQEAFRVGANVIPGKYRVFIVALRDALFSYSGIPFSIPSGYTVADTIYSSMISGRIGAAFISKQDTIRVP